jgi:DNA polymerase-1
MRYLVINKRHLSILDEIKKSGGEVDNEKPNDSVMLIDGMNLFIRVFSAIPTTNEDGVHVGGIVGFLRSLAFNINMIRPTRTIIVFDGKGGSNRRRKIFPEYKMGRKMSYRLNRAHNFLTREEEQQMMIRQLNRVVEYLECLPVSIMNMENCEADDVIGYLSKHIYKDNKTTIVSTDKDFLQLVDENTRLYSPTKKKMYDEEKVFEEYGIHPKNFLLFRMFDGDKSDGIPGVNGIGMKTLVKLFPFMKTEEKYELEDIYRSAETQKNPLCEKVLQSKDLLDMNKRLMDLEDGIISGHTKLKAKEIVERPIQRVIKHRFQKMFLEDKLYQALPNLNSWLATTFSRLNFMAEESHK